MARRQKDEDDLLMEDELAAAFLDEEGNQPDEDSEHSGDEEKGSEEVEDDPAPIADKDQEWDEDEAAVPGQLAVDVYESKEKLYVKARTAGVNKDDLDVSVADNVLTVRGTLSSGDEVEAENYHIQECYWGEFSRSITLPVQVKEDEVEAVLKDGVLTIGFTKVKQDSVKKIKVI